MKQEVLINKILRDLKLMGLVSEDTNGEFKPYLNALYAAGWEQARIEFAERTRKPVLQFNINNEFLKEYPSIEEAGKQLKVSRETIARAIKTNHLTSKRHFWRFKEKAGVNHSPALHPNSP
jgi:hypothetical protein